MSNVKRPHQISRRLIAGALVLSGSLMLMGYFKMPDRDPVEAKDQDICALQKNVPTSVSGWTPVPWPMDTSYIQFSPIVQAAYAGMPLSTLQTINCAPVGIAAEAFDGRMSGEMDRTRFAFAHGFGGLASNRIFAAALEVATEDAPRGIDPAHSSIQVFRQLRSIPVRWRNRRICRLRLPGLRTLCDCVRGRVRRLGNRLHR
jgi:hypothetical protein